MQVKQVGAASEVRPIWLTSDVNYADVTPYNSALASSFNLGPLAPARPRPTPSRSRRCAAAATKSATRWPADLFGDAKIVNGDDNTPAADTRTVAIDPTPQFDDELL